MADDNKLQPKAKETIYHDRANHEDNLHVARTSVLVNFNGFMAVSVGLVKETWLKFAFSFAALLIDFTWALWAKNALIFIRKLRCDGEQRADQQVWHELHWQEEKRSWVAPLFIMSVFIPRVLTFIWFGIWLTFLVELILLWHRIDFAGARLDTYRVELIQIAMLTVQLLGLIGLFWYVVETRKIRRAAQKQVATSLDLIKAATAQVEGMSKPCLTFWGELRDGTDAIIGTHGAVGNIVVRPDQGGYVVENIGNGVALNVRYRFTRPNDNPDLPRNPRYVPSILPATKVTLLETMAGYNAEHEVTFDYESIGGRKYRTTIQLNHHVLVSFAFAEIAL